MLARLLQHCGVDLGPKEELMPPNSDNVDGFWENVRFVALNEQILAAFGGRWDLPPKVAIKASVQTPEFLSLERKAKALLKRFEKLPCWGWKDPRNSLTLPFWQRLIPGLRAVMIVRSPLEVASSLTVRNGFSQASGLNLWRIYNERLITSMTSPGAVITHYDAFFEDPVTELRRILRLLGLPLSGAVDAAATIVSPNRRHHNATWKQMAEANIRENIVQLYQLLTARNSERRSPASAAVSFRARADQRRRFRRIALQVNCSDYRSRADRSPHQY
jgi:hypothetical protein